MAKISEEEFRKLCERFYAERESIYAAAPSMSRRDALLWMILGSLIFLLDVPADYEPAISTEKNDNFFAAAIKDVLEGRMGLEFDPEEYLSELSRKVEGNEESSS